jgi:predicted lipoprotein with Yx(FWY)xxD motif
MNRPFTMNTSTRTGSVNRLSFPGIVRFVSRGAALAMIALVLVSCGKGGKLDGTYSSSVQSYTFSGDVASVSVMGKKIGEKWPYTVEGKKITLKGASGDVVLTMNDDGSLSDPANDKLVKK